MSSGNILPLKDTLIVNDGETPQHQHKHQHQHQHQQKHQQQPAAVTRLQNNNAVGRSPAQGNSKTSLRQVCADIHGRVERFLSAPAPDQVTRRAQEQTRVATSVMAQALDDYDFESLSLSYNGGKDCLVMLILYLSVLHTHLSQPSGRRKKQQQNAMTTTTTTTTTRRNSTTGTDARDDDDEDEEDDDFPTSIPSIYAKPPDPFDAVSDFVQTSTQAYHLDLTHVSTNPGTKPNAKSHSSPPPTSGYQTPVAAEAAAAAAATTTTMTPRATTTTTSHPEPNADANLNINTNAKLESITNGDIQHLNPHPPLSTQNSSLLANSTTNAAAAAATAVSTPSSTPQTQTQPIDPEKKERQERPADRKKPIISFRDAFALYLHNHPPIRAIFVGTRRTDPHGATLHHFQMTDGNWPRFMRVHPVIDWRLSEVWCFLRSDHLADPVTGQRLPYCTMYDQGYTSLGGVSDTLRNPRLKVVGEDGTMRYRPAYEMTEDEEERAGRE